jgi:hypothetical protein
VQINLLEEYDFSNKKCRIHSIFYLPKMQLDFIAILVDGKMAISLIK